MALEDIREERTEKIETDHGQEIQDMLFRKMSVARKIRLASSFFSFARWIGAINPYGAGRPPQKNRRHPSHA